MNPNPHTLLSVNLSVPLVWSRTRQLQVLEARPKRLLLNCSHELQLSNGSRIISLPCSGDTIRGFANVKVLIIDEAARVPDDLYRTVLPMLAVSGGRLLCLSTPNGKRGAQ